MALRNIAGRRTVEEARRAWKRLGHQMSRIDAGDSVAIASCRHPGCHVMVEIGNYSYDLPEHERERGWRLINLSPNEQDPETTPCPVS